MDEHTNKPNNITNPDTNKIRTTRSTRQEEGENNKNKKELQPETPRVLPIILAKKQSTELTMNTKSNPKQKRESGNKKQPIKHTQRTKSKSNPRRETKINTDIRAFFSSSIKPATATKERGIDGEMGSNNKSKSIPGDKLTSTKHINNMT